MFSEHEKNNLKTLINAEVIKREEWMMFKSDNGDTYIGNHDGAIMRMVGAVGFPPKSIIYTEKGEIYTITD
jgi:hypothetical protein